MVEVVIHRCTLRVVRRGGWGWGPEPRKLLQGALNALPGLIARQLGQLWPDGCERDFAAPISIRVPLSMGELLAAAAEASGPDAPASSPLMLSLGARIGSAAREAFLAGQVETVTSPEPETRPRAATPVGLEAEGEDGGAVAAALLSWHRAGVLALRLAAFSPAALEAWHARLRAEIGRHAARESAAHEPRTQSPTGPESLLTSAPSASPASASSASSSSRGRRFSGEAVNEETVERFIREAARAQRLRDGPLAASESAERSTHPESAGRAARDAARPLQNSPGGRVATLRRRLILLTEVINHFGLRRCAPFVLTVLDRASPLALNRAPLPAPEDEANPRKHGDNGAGGVEKQLAALHDAAALAASRGAPARAELQDSAASTEPATNAEQTAVALHKKSGRPHDVESGTRARPNILGRPPNFYAKQTAAASERGVEARPDGPDSVRAKDERAKSATPRASGELESQARPGVRSTRQTRGRQLEIASPRLRSAASELSPHPPTPHPHAPHPHASQTSAPQTRTPAPTRSASYRPLPPPRSPHAPSQSAPHEQTRRVASALPFLLLGPLSQVGYLRTLAATLEAADALDAAPLFAAALAHKVLAPPARGWRREPAAVEAASAFAALCGPADEPATVELARRLSEHLSPLDAALAGALVSGHGAGQPLLLLRTGASAAGGLLLVEVEGTFPVRWAASAAELRQVLSELDSSPLLVPRSCAGIELLRWLDEERFTFITDAPPTRGESWRALRRPPRECWWTNETLAPDATLVRAARAMGDAAEEAAAVWEALFVARPAVPLAGDAALERHLTLAAATALGTVAWELWRGREPTTPRLALERFADLEARVAYSPDSVRVSLPLGMRYQDLRGRGLLEDVPGVPWLGGRTLTFASG